MKLTSGAVRKAARKGKKISHHIEPETKIKRKAKRRWVLSEEFRSSKGDRGTGVERRDRNRIDREKKRGGGGQTRRIKRRDVRKEKTIAFPSCSLGQIRGLLDSEDSGGDSGGCSALKERSLK